MPALGFKTYMRINRETTYGTGVTPNRKYELVSWNVGPVIGTIPDPSLYNAQSRRSYFQGGTLVKGTFVVRLNYEGMHHLFRAIAGASTNAPDVAAVTTPPGRPGTWDLFYKENPTLSGYTIEVQPGDPLADTKVMKIIGAKLISVTIRGTAGQGADAMLQAEFTVLGKSVTGNQTAAAITPILVTGTSATVADSATLTRSTGDFNADGVLVGMTITQPNVIAGTTVQSIQSATSLTMSSRATASQTLQNASFVYDYPRVLPVLFHHADLANCNDGVTSGTGIRLRGFEFTLEQPHTEDRFYFGSVNIDEPVRSDFLTVRYRMTREFDSWALFNAATGFTQGAPKILMKSPLDAQANTATFREFEVHSNNAYLTDWSAPVESYGIIVQTATWEAVYDAVTDLSAFVIRTRQTDAPAGIA